MFMRPGDARASPVSAPPSWKQALHPAPGWKQRFESGPSGPATELQVQRECAACASANESDTPVQLWDCTKYPEPTCVQNEADSEAATLQAKCAACEGDDVQQDGADGPPARAPTPGVIQRAARQGLNNADRPLPHGEEIQASFGRHDVSEVRTSIGGTAARASHRMGALAFTSGRQIGFRDHPDLRLAAHEAAHTVQQRAGLSLPGNVGRPGDPFERHADRVADAVVSGRSAEPLLDEVAPGSAESAEGEPNVQRQLTSFATRTFEPALEPREAAVTPSSAGPSAAAPAKAAVTDTEPQASPEQALEQAKATDTGESPPQPEGGASGPKDEGVGASGGIDAPCYGVDSAPAPEDAAEPKQDAPSSDVEEDTSVEFPGWEGELDDCEAAGDIGEQAAQLPEPLRGESAPEVAAQAAPLDAGVAGESASPEVQAMSSSVEAQADQSLAASGQFEGQIESAAAGRDAAVAEYVAASSGLGDIAARAQRASASFSLGSADTSEAGRLREAQSSEQVRAFMAGAAEQVALAVAFASDQVPGRLGGLAEATKANIAGTMEVEKGLISARVEQARSFAQGQADAARAHVLAQHQASEAHVNQETDVAIALLGAQYAASLVEVDRKETEGLDGVNERFAIGRTNHEALGPQYAIKAVARGQQHAHAYERCKKRPDGPMYDDDGFWDGCLTVRRAKAQQDAACKTAAGYEKQLVRAANEKAYNLKAHRASSRCALIAGAGQVQETLTATHEQLVSGLESGRERALAGLAMAREQNVIAVEQNLSATLQALDSQEYTQRQAVDDTGYLRQLAVEQLAHQTAAGLAGGISAALLSLEQTLASLRERFASGEAPDPIELAGMLAEAEQGLGGGMGSLLARMEEGAASAELQIIASGAGALESLTGITAQNDELSATVESGFGDQMSSSMAGASTLFAELAGSHVSRAQETASTGVASMLKIVAGFDEAVASIYRGADEAIAGSMTELEQTLKGMLGRLDGQIAIQAWEAAKKEQPAWKSVVAILLIIVVIIVATVISIVTLGAGASLFAIILVGALVGAVSGALIQMINNWAAGEDIFQMNVLTAAVMGAIGGAIGGAFGFAGAAIGKGLTSVAARFATTLASDVLSEAATQAVGYVAFGQQFNWQGFVMAGAVSGVGFRANPAAAARQGAGAAARQIAGGALVGVGVEVAASAITGENLDLTRVASAAASAGAAARSSRLGGHGPQAPAARPHAEGVPARSRAAKALDRVRTLGAGTSQRIEQRLEGVGQRLAGSRVASEAAPIPSRHEGHEQARTPPRSETSKQHAESEAELATLPRSQEGPDEKTATGPHRTAEANRPIDTSAPVLAEAPVTLGGRTHTLKVVSTEQGVVFTLCSWCSRLTGQLQHAVDSMPAGPQRDRVGELLDFVRAREAQFPRDLNTPPPREADPAKLERPETLKELLGVLAEAEALIDIQRVLTPAHAPLSTAFPTAQSPFPAGLGSGEPNARKNIAKPPPAPPVDWGNAAASDAIRDLASQRYPDIFKQLWQSRVEFFAAEPGQVRHEKKGPLVERPAHNRALLIEALKAEARARALVEARDASLGTAPRPLHQEPTAAARTTIDPETDFPMGFPDRATFDTWAAEVTRLVREQDPTARVELVGSSITGRRFDRKVTQRPTGAPFDLGRLSDYDVSISSDVLMRKAEAERIRILTEGIPRTDPLGAPQLDKLELSAAAQAANAGIITATGIAHDVNFKIYGQDGPAEGTLRLPLHR